MHEARCMIGEHTVALDSRPEVRPLHDPDWKRTRHVPNAATIPGCEREEEDDDDDVDDELVDAQFVGGRNSWGSIVRSHSVTVMMRKRRRRRRRRRRGRGARESPHILFTCTKLTA